MAVIQVVSGHHTVVDLTADDLRFHCPCGWFLIVQSARTLHAAITRHPELLERIKEHDTSPWAQITDTATAETLVARRSYGRSSMFRTGP